MGIVEFLGAGIIAWVLLHGAPEPKQAPEAPKTEIEQCREMCESGTVARFKHCKCKEQPW